MADSRPAEITPIPVTGPRWMQFLSIFFVCLIVLAILASMYRYIEMQDFDSYFHVPCDSETESCFIASYECEEDESGMCTDYYKMLVLPTAELNSCTPDDGECLLNVCATGGTCAYFECSIETQEYFGVYDECSI